jgi:hypothetical protein
LQLRNQREGRQLKAGRPKLIAGGHQSPAADFCNKIGQQQKCAARQNG